MSRIKVFVAATFVSMLALVGLAAPASAALIGPPDPDAELLRVCITIRPASAPLVCVNL